MLFGLQISIFLSYVDDARTVLMGVQVVVTDYHSLGVTPVQVFQQLSHRSLLFGCSRVSRLTAGIVASFVAYADGVLVVVQAVGANHPFRSAGLNLSVTTDDVVVADTEFPASLAMPRIYLSGGRCLVGPYCRTMNDD